jgi:dissimilatory sulfite reductase related protein
MAQKEYAGKTIELDDDGFMVDMDAWNEGIAKEIAKEDGIEELTPRHFEILQFMRKEFVEKGSAPSIRRFKNAGGVEVKELYKLFPKGPAKKAARAAGIPKPQGCV